MHSLERRFRATTFFLALRAVVPHGMLFLAACGGYGSGTNSAAPPLTIALDVLTFLRTNERQPLSRCIPKTKGCRVSRRSTR
jgi:hypothetical protein